MFNRNDSKPTELQLLKADLISPEIKILLDSEEVYSNLINNRTMQESESPDIIITKDNNDGTFQGKYDVDRMTAVQRIAYR